MFDICQLQENTSVQNPAPFPEVGRERGEEKKKNQINNKIPQKQFPKSNFI